MRKLFFIYLALVVAACVQGPRGGKGAPGAKGTNGTNGSNGIDGTNGTNGVDGQDGEDGVDAILEIIDPCGDQTQFDEVILRMSNGVLIAFFTDGHNNRLSVLSPGTYQTTDGTACTFTVTSEGLVQ